MPFVNVDVDVDIYDFDTEDLIEELENRGYFVSTDTIKPLSDDVLILANRLRTSYHLTNRINSEDLFSLLELITGKVTP